MRFVSISFNLIRKVITFRISRSQDEWIYYIGVLFT